MNNNLGFYWGTGRGWEKARQARKLLLEAFSS